MRLNFVHERVLAVVAHPDDAELLCAGTLARAQHDQAATGICVLCQGNKGQPIQAIPDLAELRRQEMKAAAGVLGAELFLGEFSDGELRDGASERQVLLSIFRRFRPTLVLAHAPEDYHPDHRAASALAEAVSWFAASAGHGTREAPLDRPPVLWWMDTVRMLQFTPGFFIDITNCSDRKHQALRCHASQLRRGGDANFAELEQLMEWQYRSRGAQAGTTAAEAFRMHAAWMRIGAW